MKSGVYLDSSVPSFYFDEREKLQFQISITKKWFEKEVENHRIYISRAVIAEVSNGSYPNKSKIMSFIDSFEILD